ncbi:hypothetical protein C2G38_2177125 [Gigaspora rosea]|uniref:Uncharacterized protein n=1 Tax=Gigaspora rosea TaxID=44941 RepID=A0A397VHD7_9GLOM|nr:hypothetical protein C2G38_2177125 [Gigaspora rosea]
MKEDEEEIKINYLLVQYYSELENILGSLNEYNVYEKHYNQVIRNDNFIKRLQNNLQFSTSINKECNNNQERFSLKNLLLYTPLDWLSKCNLVIVEFIKTIIYNENKTQLIENLASKQVVFPEGLVFLAFDNEQKGQKNYLDRRYNTVIFHTVTSFAAFQYDQNNNIQLNQDTWLYSELTQEQYKSLFYLNLEMKNEIDQELYKYLQSIIDELIEEKNQTNSLINKLMNDNEQTGYIKKCLVYQTSNINNKKQLCSNYYPWLILLPGPLHKEINILKAFVELNWDIDIKNFAQLTDKEQILKLKPKIYNLIQENIVISRSRLLDQYQELDTIFEEINKAFKSLIPPIPSQYH